jgi:hypothetical protein
MRKASVHGPRGIRETRPRFGLREKSRVLVDWLSCPSGFQKSVRLVVLSGFRFRLAGYQSRFPRVKAEAVPPAGFNPARGHLIEMRLPAMHAGL